MPPGRRLCLAGLALLLLLLCACQQHLDIVTCDAEPWSQYDETLAGILPNFEVRYEHEGMLAGLKKGSVVETYDLLATPALALGIASHWYPQYMATVVLAVDRSQTDIDINGWADLSDIRVPVGMSDRIPEMHLLMAAMSYGLEGEVYTGTHASQLLGTLYRSGLLKTNRYDAPITICFDHQAAAMAAAGRNIDIIVPAEGTLSFGKGLLAQKPLSMPTGAEALLLEAGFRLPDGRTSAPCYPAPEAYAPAVLLADYNQLLSFGADVMYIYKRDVQQLYSYFYSSGNGRMHQLFALSFVVLVILWMGFVLRRVMQKGVRRTTLLAGIMVIGWVMLRVFKYQIPYGIVNQYCWYGYYAFQLGIPLVILWMSWVVDKSENVLHPPRWWRICAGFNAVLFVLVFTNNLHHLAFKFLPDDPNYAENYTYGPIYYLCILAIFMEALVAQVIFIRKNWKNPRKAGFMLPVVFYCLLLGYCVAYIFRIPLIWETDLTIVTGTFVVLFIETCIRTGLIPVNTRYKDLFEHSPMKMKIVDLDGATLLTSALEVTPQTQQDAPGECLVYTDTISGGTVVWQEDIGSIRRLDREIQASMAKLEAVNAMLIEEERIRSRLAAAEERAAITTALTLENEQKILRLSAMIDALPDEGGNPAQIAAITMLLCYIKRRCNLFFREREIEDIRLDELAAYMEELSEFASYAGVHMHSAYEHHDSMPTRQATLFYDFVYATLEWLLQCKAHTLLVRIERERDRRSIKLLYAGEDRCFCPEASLDEAITAAGGCVETKDLDDAMGISLCFPTGGEAHA